MPFQAIPSVICRTSVKYTPGECGIQIKLLLGHEPMQLLYIAIAFLGQPLWFVVRYRDLAFTRFFIPQCMQLPSLLENVEIVYAPVGGDGK